MNAETIEKWKQNRIPNWLLTDAEFAELIGFGFDDLEFTLTRECWHSNFGYLCDKNSDYIHRLRPDYEPPKPEPKYVKCEIKSQRDYAKRFYYLKFDYLDKEYFLSDAVDFVNFSHFEKENGNKIGIENIAHEIRSIEYGGNGGKVSVVMVEAE